MPWLVPLTDRVVACKDSSLLACFTYTGVDADGSVDGTAAQLEAVMDAAMTTWRSQPVTIWWTLRRQRTNDFPGVRMPSPVAQMLDDEQRKVFLTRGGHVNRYFVSVLWSPPRGMDAFMDRMGAYMADGQNIAAAGYHALRAALSTRDSFAWKAADLDIAIRSFEGLLEQFSGTLSLINPRRLIGDELIGFLWGCANPGFELARKAMPTDGRMLDSLLPERVQQTYRDTLVFDPDTSAATYLTAVSLKEFPDVFRAGALDNLLSAPCEAIYSVAFRVADTPTAAKRMSSVRTMANMTKFPIKSLIAGAFQHGQMNPETADPSKSEDVEQAIEAQGELSSGRRYFGWMNVTLCLYDDDYDRVVTVTDNALRLLRGGQFVGAVREKVHLLSAWTCTLPGAWEECRRWYFNSDANCSDMAPVVTVSCGQRWNRYYSEQLGGRQPALTVLPTDRATPYYFNFHVGDVGHAFVVGPTGSGKSTVMNFLISEFQKYPGARTIIFDRDRSCRITALLEGATWIDARPDSGLHLNPYALVDRPEHRPFLARFTESLLASHGYQIQAEDTESVWQAIQGAAADHAVEHHRLMAIYTLLPQKLKAQLAPWIEGGQYGEYFDHVEDSFALARFTCIEMGELMQDPVLAAVFMEYVFYRIEMMLKPAPGKPVAPTMMYVEESSFLVQIPWFALRLIGWLKTFRKLVAHIILTTQSPEDWSDNEMRKVFAAMRDNILTRIYLPNVNAASGGLRELYTKVFQLTSEQTDRIAKAIPKSEYLITQPGLARMVSARLTPHQVSALRSDQKAQQLFDSIWKNGKGGAGWQQRYLEAIEAA